MKTNMYKYLLTGFLLMGIFAAHAQTLGGDNPCKPIKILGPSQSDGSMEESYLIHDQFGCGSQGYKWQYSGALSVNGQMVSNAGGTGSLVTNDNTLLVKWNVNAQNVFLKAQSVDHVAEKARRYSLMWLVLLCRIMSMNGNYLKDL